MSPSHKHTHILLSLLAVIVMSAAALAADPGSPYAFNEPSDSRPGNLLVYNLYTSSISNPTAQNSRINITNVSSTSGVSVHFFFVDGESCSVADSFICLTPNQTMSFLASDVDPGVTGYIIAVATDSNGLPLAPSISFGSSLVNLVNQEEEPPPPPPMLIGDEFIKLASGQQSNLPAEGMTPPFFFPPPPEPGPGPSSPASAPALVTDIPDAVTLVIDSPPCVLAVSSIPSRADGNDPLLIVNSLGGDLRTSAAPIGNLFGIVFDQLENPYSWTATAGCQLFRPLNNNFPRTTPRLSSIIPSGATGWMKFWSTGTTSSNPAAIFGAIINNNGSAGSNSSAFNQGRNLHKLTFGSSVTLTIPVFPSNCGGPVG